MSLLKANIPFTAALLAVTLWLLAPGLTRAADAAGPVICKDGTSAAHGGRGACSGHGGIDKAATSASMNAASPTTGASTGQSAPAAGPAPGEPSTAAVLCNDGTTAAHGGRGACSGHGGIARSARAPSGNSGAAMKGAAPAATGAQAPAEQPSTAASPAPRAQPAPGGGPGRVWVNTQSKVYHCPSDRWYGKTQQGEYMTEAQAKSQGYRPDHNKPCP